MGPNRRLIFTWLSPAPFFGVLLAVTLAGCGKPRQVAQTAPPSVTVSQPAQEQIADYLDLTGTVAPSRSVDLVARVSGYLRSASFDEGTSVEADQLLFLIEPEPYEQQLRLAEAALLRAQSEYDRQEQLMKDNATSAANVEKWRSERDQASAQVEIAKLNLSYTRITAPFKGRIGRRLVDPGNLVGPSVNTKLATVDRLDPIYVYFNLNERDALRIRQYMRERGVPEFNPQQRKVPVLVGLQNQEGYPLTGNLEFVDSGVSTGSGTVQMRAQFENKDRVLFPGLFARVRIPLSEVGSMLVVPNSAIGNDQEGDYVLVVDASDTVVRRTVVKGPLARGGCTIRSGVTPADRVIINGLMRARPGAKVTPVNAGSDHPPAPKTAAWSMPEVFQPGSSHRGPTCNLKPATRNLC
ncbi:MAG TPA: efflux RND transporter periplasmic adaptor subunit [Verrucomicrobiae bacterium]